MEASEDQPPPLPESEPLPPRWPAILVVMACWVMAFLFPMLLAGIVVITSEEGEPFTVVDGYPFLMLALMVFATFGMTVAQILIAFRVIHFRLRTYFWSLAGFLIGSAIIIFATFSLVEPRPVAGQLDPERLGELSAYLTCPLFVPGGIVWLVGIIVKWK